MKSNSDKKQFDPSKLPKGFDPSKLPKDFDPSKAPKDFDPSRMPGAGENPQGEKKVYKRTSSSGGRGFGGPGGGPGGPPGTPGSYPMCRDSNGSPPYATACAQ